MPVRLLASLTDLTETSPSHRGFYIQAFHESVTLLVAGYHYDSHWTVLSMGLSPTGMAAILAAPDPYERVNAYGSHLGEGARNVVTRPHC
jgi:hypothetical protein